MTAIHKSGRMAEFSEAIWRQMVSSGNTEGWTLFVAEPPAEVVEALTVKTAEPPAEVVEATKPTKTK